MKNLIEILLFLLKETQDIEEFMFSEIQKNYFGINPNLDKLLKDENKLIKKIN